MPEENSQNGSSRPAIDVLKEMFSQMDPFAEQAAKRMKATCTKGCFHCCMLLTSMMFTEGLLVAEKLLKEGTWKDYLPKLREASQEVCYEGISKGSYFSKKKRCVFLSEEGLCNIYNERPSCCRYHYVVSDPADCSPDRPGARTGILDLITLEKNVWNMDAEVVKELLEIPMLAAPIPLMVLFCLDLATVQDEDIHEEVQKAISGLPDPLNWLMTYGFESVVTDGDLPREVLEKVLAR